MRKKSTRLVSAALAACMMLSVLPVGAFAAGTGAEPESGVSVQAEATKLNAGDEINDTGNYTMSGDYATGITINTTGDVTITITGQVGIASGNLIKVVNVGKLTIENKDNKTVETAANQAGYLFLIESTNTGTVTVNGGTYKSTEYGHKNPFEIDGGTVLLNDATVKAYNNAVYIKNGNVTITRGVYSGIEYTNYPARHRISVLEIDDGVLTIYDSTVSSTGKNSNGSIWLKNGICNIHGGNYSAGVFSCIAQSGGTLNIYDGNFTTGGDQGGSVFVQEGGICDIKNGNFKANKKIITLFGGEYGSTCNIENGNFISQESNVLSVETDNYYNRNATCNIENGTFRTLSSYLTVHNSSYNGGRSSFLNIHGGTFEGAGTVIGADEGSETSIDEEKNQTVIRCIDGGDESSPKVGIRGDRTSKVTIISCTIENAKHGIWLRKLRNGTASVTLKNAEFNNNTNDIYLDANQEITIEDTFTDTATIKCEDATSGRQITTEDGDEHQKNLKLISLDDADNGRKYLIDWKQENGQECRYLAKGYTVTTEDATATLEGEKEELNTPVVKGTKVTVTAKEKPGYRFTGWTVKVGGVKVENPNTFLHYPDADIPAEATFTMPDADVEVKANYKDASFTPPEVNTNHMITVVNGTADKQDAAVGETVNVTAAEKPGKRFTGWTVKVGGVKVENPNTFLHYPDANIPAEATFTMPDADVEIEANYTDEIVFPGPDEEPTDPKVNTDHTVTVVNGIISKINGERVPGGPDKTGAAVDDKVTLIADEKPGYRFVGWISDNYTLTDEEKAMPELTVTMPDHDIGFAADYEEASFDPEQPVVTDDGSGSVIGGVIIGSAIAVGAYEAGTGIYRVINMPGIPMPSNRIELAELIWEHAGKPEPESTEFYGDISEDDTDWQKAARWAVEQDLMQDDADNNEFHPYFPVSKLRTCLTWNAAKEKGLFDKTEE